MIRRPPRSTLSSSSAASDVYKRQAVAVKPLKEFNVALRQKECCSQTKTYVSCPIIDHRVVMHKYCADICQPSIVQPRGYIRFECFDAVSYTHLTLQTKKIV